MRYAIIVLLFLASLSTFAQSKDKVTDTYTIAFTKIDADAGPKISVKAYDTEKHDFYYYALVINDVILDNGGRTAPFRLAVMPDSKVKIICKAVGYQNIELPKLLLHRGETATVTFRLKEDTTPLH